MTLHRFLTAGLLVTLVGLTGCQPLRFDKTYDIERGDSQTIDFDAPRYEQKVKVEVSSPGVAVSAFLVKEEDKAAAERATGKPAGALGGQEKAESISFEATVPAKTAFTVVVHNVSTEKAHVQVKISGR